MISLPGSVFSSHQFRINPGEEKAEDKRRWKTSGQGRGRKEKEEETKPAAQLFHLHPHH